MNVQRDVYGRLKPAEFPGVLELPNPVLQSFRVKREANNDSLFSVDWPVHSSVIQTTDTEMTDFHGQRMSVVR